MSGIFTYYIGVVLGVNVCKYARHGVFGFDFFHWRPSLQRPSLLPSVGDRLMTHSPASEQKRGETPLTWGHPIPTS